VFCDISFQMFLSNIQPPSSGWTIKAKRKAVWALKMEAVMFSWKVKSCSSAILGRYGVTNWNFILLFRIMHLVLIQDRKVNQTSNNNYSSS
jgi:hypothetical protein